MINTNSYQKQNCFLLEDYTEIFVLNFVKLVGSYSLLNLVFLPTLNTPSYLLKQTNIKKKLNETDI